MLPIPSSYTTITFVSSGTSKPASFAIVYGDCPGTCDFSLYPYSSGGGGFSSGGGGGGSFGGGGGGGGFR